MESESGSQELPAECKLLGAVRNIAMQFILREAIKKQAPAELEDDATQKY